MKTDSNLVSDPAHSPIRRNIAMMRKWVRRSLLMLFGCLLSYGLLVLIGMIPVNGDFAEPESGVEIFVFSGAFHSDLILPIETSTVDWRTKFIPGHTRAAAPWATHMAFGWGDRNFYINTPSWADLKASTACSALLMPSETVMHVSYQTEPATDEETRSVTISTDQYQTLVEFINESFRSKAPGEFQQIQDQCYGDYDAFYQGAGNYHCFRTCNCWVSEGLQRAGVKTGWFTPLPKTVFLYLPD